MLSAAESTTLADALSARDWDAICPLIAKVTDPGDVRMLLNRAIDNNAHKALFHFIDHPARPFDAVDTVFLRYLARELPVNQEGRDLFLYMISEDGIYTDPQAAPAEQPAAAARRAAMLFDYVSRTRDHACYIGYMWMVKERGYDSLPENSINPVHLAATAIIMDGNSAPFRILLGNGLLKPSAFTADEMSMLLVGGGAKLPAADLSELVGIMSNYGTDYRRLGQDMAPSDQLDATVLTILMNAPQQDCHRLIASLAENDKLNDGHISAMRARETAPARKNEMLAELCLTFTKAARAPILSYAWKNEDTHLLDLCVRKGDATTHDLSALAQADIENGDMRPASHAFFNAAAAQENRVRMDKVSSAGRPRPAPRKP